MKKIAILSATGSGKKRTIPAIRDSQIAEVVAIHGRAGDKLCSLSAETGIKAFTSLDELSQIDFDVLYVASPPFLHAEQIRHFSNMDIPIICEKPLCISPEDTKEFEHISPRRFMLAHHLRHQPAISKIKEIIERKELGEVRSAHFQWNFNLNKTAPSAQWKLDPNLGGDNPFYDAGSHAIDLAIHLFGMPTAIYATGQSAPEIGRYVSASATAVYEGFPVFLIASSAQTPTGNDLLIYFEHGYIRAQGAFTESSIRTIDLYSAGGQQDLLMFEHTNLYRNEVESFCADLDNRSISPIGTTLEQALQGMAILHTISSSLAEARAVEVAQ